ncbi:LysE family transporter [Pseudosulfitobacter sp. SM2401]|uniref:LysE family translocator n=1 Tax=Pseudosulfitobacter sp. SM2401 TaxID=3350098 RepID=UPI0036F23EFA
MIEFIAAVFFLIITPGPGVLTTAGIGAAYGYRHGLAFIGGLYVGGFIVMILVLSGIAAAGLAIPWLRTVLLLASVGYLLFLAWRIATAGARIGFIDPTKPLGFWNGLALQPINPKAYVVTTTLFSGFAMFPDAFLFEVTVKILIYSLIWTPLHVLWLFAGVRLRQLNLGASTQRAINIAMACAMLLVVGLALFSSL